MHYKGRRVAGSIRRRGGDRWDFSMTFPGRTMAVEPSQPLTERSARGVSWGVKAVRRADDLATYMCRLCYPGTLSLLGSSAFTIGKSHFGSSMAKRE